jgi:hypothetical protein
MANNQITISWDAATQISLEEQQKEITRKKEYEKNVSRANSELWNMLGHEHFNFSDFEDVCYHNGIEQDDLINTLI